jgi:replicative DNA helicase
MRSFDRFIEAVERGKEGMNEGLPLGMPALEQFIPNLQKKHYYLIGGNTGSGKTTLMRDKFLFGPVEHIQKLELTENPMNLDIRGILFSFEMDLESVISAAISRRVYFDHKKTFPSNYIMSRGKNRISKEDYEIVSAYSDYWEYYEKKFIFHDTTKTVAQIEAAIRKLALDHGVLYKNTDGFEYYVPHNPNMYFLVYIDHLALTEISKGSTIEKTMEELSKVLVKARNLYHMTFVVIQQLNMDLFDPVRVKIGRPAPMLSDFGDSKKISRDVDVVLALHNPAMFAQEQYAGYDITQLRAKFRSIEVLKNRYGESDKRVGVFFNGAVGVLKELPEAASPAMLQVYEQLKIKSA